MTNPLTAEDKTKIEAALKAINEVKKDIIKAKMAGIDVSEQEKTLNETEQGLLAVKKAYFSTARA